MRRLVGCLGLVLAAACGGSSSGGGSVAPGNDGGVVSDGGGSVAPGNDGGEVSDGGSVAPGNDGGVVSDGGSVQPEPDGGAPAADAGTAAPDGGTTTAPPDGGTPPAADGGTASACDGLAPSLVGPAGGTHRMTLIADDRNICQAATNGSGGLAFSVFDSTDAGANRTDFLAPDGTPRGSRLRGPPSEWSSQILGRLSTFLDLEQDGDSSSAADVLVAQDDRGDVLRTSAAGPAPRALVEDPLGGAMVASYDASDTNHEGPVTLTSFDANGVQRFRVVLSASQPMFFDGLVVDRQGNALMVTLVAGGSVLGQWVTHDGAPGPVFTLLGPSGEALQEMTPRVGGGLFFRRGADWSQLDSLSATVLPGPAWLNAVTSAGVYQANLFMARNGRAYAVVALQMHECVDEVEVFAPDGESCGKAKFPGNLCGRLQVGFDGTLLRTDQGCVGTSCTCTFQWWTGFFH